MAVWVGLDEPLYTAASEGNTQEVERLLSRRSDPNVVLEDYPAIVSAADGGYKDVVRLLIKAGARLDVRDSFDHRTPIMAAQANNHPDVILILRGAGEKQ